MLILLDENIPHRLRGMLGGHDVRTTTYQGWAGLANGALLKAADDAGFEAVITADQGIQYQQNRTECRLALIVLRTNKEVLLIENADSILAALSTAAGGTVVFVDVGT
ncbi:MAG: hypothetical protein ABI972_26685 [Acidobacteriota bacterium]